MMQVTYALIPIFIALGVTIFILIRNQQKKSKSALKRHEELIGEILIETNTKVDFRKQLIHQNLIIDTAAQKLLLIDHRNARYDYNLIKLADIQGCKLKSLTESLQNDGGKGKVEMLTKQIGLEIILPVISQNPPLVIFYDINRHNVYVESDMREEARMIQERIMDAKKNLIPS